MTIIEVADTPNFFSHQCMCLEFSSYFLLLRIQILSLQFYSLSCTAQFVFITAQISYHRTPKLRMIFNDHQIINAIQLTGI